MDRFRSARLPAGYWASFGDALYIYRFEIMILLRVKAKSLLCYWAVRNLGIGMAQIARRLNRNSERIPRSLLRGMRANQKMVNFLTVEDSL